MTLPPSKKDIDRSIQKYRDINDIYCEKGLVSILFLSCGKHLVMKNCLNKLMKILYKNKDNLVNLEFIFLEQGFDNFVKWTTRKDEEKNLNFIHKMVNDYSLDRAIIITPNKNYGINNAINQMWRVCRGEYVLFLESDWYLNAADDQWLKDSVEILDKNEDVGIVQLRDIRDPNENWGFGKPEYNPFSIDYDAPIEVRLVSNSEVFLVATDKIYGVSNNPALWRKSMRRELGPMKEPEIWADLKHGETDYQMKFIETDWKTAHIARPIFCHAGNPIFERRFKEYGYC